MCLCALLWQCQIIGLFSLTIPIIFAFHDNSHWIEFAGIEISSLPLVIRGKRICRSSNYTIMTWTLSSSLFFSLPLTLYLFLKLSLSFEHLVLLQKYHFIAAKQIVFISSNFSWVKLLVRFSLASWHYELVLAECHFRISIRVAIIFHRMKWKETVAGKTNRIFSWKFKQRFNHSYKEKPFITIHTATWLNYTNIILLHWFMMRSVNWKIVFCKQWRNNNNQSKFVVDRFA